MAPQQTTRLPLPQETESADALRLLLATVQDLRKEVVELRSKVETNDLTRKATGAPQGGGGGIGLGEALALIKSTQNDTVQLITGLLNTVSRQQADTQAAFFKGIQFNKSQTTEIISQLSAEDLSHAEQNGDGRVSLGQFAEVLIEKGMELMAGAQEDGELDGMEDGRNALQPAPAPGPRPAAPGHGGFDPEENR